MKFILESPTTSVVQFFRRAGYHFERREGKELSFAKRLTDKKFPRFHLFCRRENGKILVNIHLDHKRVSYAGQRRHGGEYGGSDLLKEEIKRLKNLGN